MRSRKTLTFIPIITLMFFSFFLLLQGANDSSSFKNLLSSKRGPEEKEEFYKVLPLKPDGSFSLKNVNGTITIRTWSKENVEIKAVKSTKYGRERLDKVKIEIESSPDFVSVETVYPKLRNIRVNVSYEVKVPSGANLQKVSSVNGNVDISGPLGEVTASTTNGKVNLTNASGTVSLSTTNGGIEAKDIKGDLQAKTVNGSIDLEIDDLKDDVKATTVNGSVSVKFFDFKEINAFLEAKTVNGRISCDFPITLKNFRMSKHNLEGQLGEGGAQIYLRTVNGSVKIIK